MDDVFVFAETNCRVIGEVQQLKTKLANKMRASH